MVACQQSAFDEEIRTAFIWPAVSDVCFEGEKDVEEQIVRILSIALDEALEKDEELFEENLLDDRYQIIQRTAMYVLANAIIVATDERLDKYLKIVDSVFLCSGILDGDYDSELYPLVRAACDRRPNFSVVGLLSGLEDSIGRYRERYERVPFNGVNLEEADKVEMVEKRARMQRHRILSLIGKEHLPGEYLEEFTELENEFGDVTYQERRSFPVQMQIGPTSPMILEQMKSMAPGELLSYL